MVSLTTVTSSMVFIVVTNQSDFEFDPSTCLQSRRTTYYLGNLSNIDRKTWIVDVLPTGKASM